MDAIAKWYASLGPGGPAVVALVVFVLTRLAEIITHWAMAHKARQRLLVGLFREISEDVASIDKFLKENPSSQAMREAVRANKELRPLMIIDETSQFFDANTAALPSIDRECLVVICDFYAQLRRVNAIKDGFESNAWTVIRDESRASTVDQLWDGSERARDIGQAALRKLERNYSHDLFAALKS